jgi:uncharacterized membrane protein
VALLGAGALAGRLLFRRSKAVPAKFSSTILAVSLIVSVLMAWAANLGGMVRHTELRPNSIPPAVSSERND